MRERAARAIAAVSGYIAALPGSPRTLYPAEVWSYASRGVVAGWRLEIAFTDQVRRVDVLVGLGFPRDAPRIVLIDRPDFLTWAHVEGDGALCLLRNTAEVDPADPLGTLVTLLSDACALVEGLIAGLHVEDMRDEFLSYWNWKANGDGRAMRSLLEPVARTRRVRLWSGTSFRLIADSDGEIGAWLDRLGGGKAGSPKDRVTTGALAIALDRPLLPFEYPRTGGDLSRLADANGAGELLSELVARDDGDVVAVLMAPGGIGVGLVGVTVPSARPANLRGVAKSVQPKGFRTGSVPPPVAELRRLGGTVVRRVNVARVDPAWVHGRDADPRATRLRSATVVVLGCGSVGGPVATALAQAGVGRLVLIDPEGLTASNVGRHPLGMDALARAKAAALAARIGSALPHVRVEHRTAAWQAVAASEPELLGADLIVSAIGSWSAEGALDEWRRADRSRPPVVYGWTEAHAVAGHAVALMGDACLGCGLSAHGEPLLAVSSWPTDTVQRETGCGSFYQPYGPIELMNVTALVAGLAIDCLLGVVTRATRRIWSAGGVALQRSGGTYTPEFQLMVPAGNGLSSFTIEREWSARAHCRECGRSIAA